MTAAMQSPWRNRIVGTLGRRCYAMEIDPKYVQVAIERWQAFTGQKAERIDG